MIMRAQIARAIGVGARPFRPHACFPFIWAVDSVAAVGVISKSAYRYSLIRTETITIEQGDSNNE
jgi:hypothetical protein